MLPRTCAYGLARLVQQGKKKFHRFFDVFSVAIGCWAVPLPLHTIVKLYARCRYFVLNSTSLYYNIKLQTLSISYIKV